MDVPLSLHTQALWWNNSWCQRGYPEVVILLDCCYPLQVWNKEVGPVECLNYHASIFSSYQLCKIAFGRIVDYLCNGLKTVHFRSPKSSFEQPKTPIRGELCMPNNKKRKSDGCMPAIRLLQLYYPKMFKCIPNSSGFLCLQRIRGTDDRSAILLTLPTKIRSRLQDNYRWYQCPPKIAG